LRDLSEEEGGGGGGGCDLSMTMAEEGGEWWEIGIWGECERGVGREGCC